MGRHVTYFVHCVTFRSQHAVLFVRKTRGGVHVDGLRILSLLEFLSQSVYRTPAERHKYVNDKDFILNCIYSKSSGPSRQSRPSHVLEERMAVTFPSPFERALLASSPTRALPAPTRPLPKSRAVPAPTCP
jgi:hypothetical protein